MRKSTTLLAGMALFGAIAFIPLLIQLTTGGSATSAGQSVRAQDTTSEMRRTVWRAIERLRWMMMIEPDAARCGDEQDCSLRGPKSSAGSRRLTVLFMESMFQ